MRAVAMKNVHIAEEAPAEMEARIKAGPLFFWPATLFFWPTTLFIWSTTCFFAPLLFKPPNLVFCMFSTAFLDPPTLFIWPPPGFFDHLFFLTP